MEYKEAVDYIYGRQMFGMKLGLKNIEDLLSKLGNPEKKFKSVHIAGTNGKGSTAEFLRSILQKQGYKVGVYTSPHLIDFRERMKLGGEKISEEKLCSILEEIKKYVKDHTFFEVTTAIAFQHFAESEVDIAIIEVGLGGRLDATNVINPLVSVITNISIDHAQHLGNTLSEIAGEKAGIIKKGVPCIVPFDVSGMEVIKKKAEDEGSELVVVEKGEIDEIDADVLGIKGSYQKNNAALALKVIEFLKNNGLGVSDKAIGEGLSSAYWPGRMQWINDNLLLDCAHNPAGAAALASELVKIKETGKKVHLVIGVMKDKDIKGICDALCPVADTIVITKAKIDRAADTNLLMRSMESTISDSAELSVIEDIGEAIEFVKLKAGKEGLGVVAGSIFVVGEALSYLDKEI